MKNFLIGYDIGSSSIKVSLIDADSGELIASAFSPKNELEIEAPRLGWAEQTPEIWWKHLIIATQEISKKANIYDYKVHGIGISYQMHGLVVVDQNQEVLYKSIIWCDSRAVATGKKIEEKIGVKHSFKNYLNLPGNFTVSKLKWLKGNHPEIYSKIYKFMLPGDYIAMKLTGKISTTISGLSEAILWNFEKQKPAYELLEALDIDKEFIPELTPTFGNQGLLTKSAADKLGLQAGVPISYRAGDQPNNALSLNVLKEGEIAATAGTSGVIYGITKKNVIDEFSRINSFAHVNYSKDNQNKGVLLCINGTASLYRWLKQELFSNNYSYEDLNSLSAKVAAGSNGLFVLPFGNGAERTLNNENIGCNIIGIDLNLHTKNHLIRSSLEGIAFAFRYGLEIMEESGMKVYVVKVGTANLFLSEEFSQMFSNICNVNIEVFNTDGAQGAARGAGIGVSYYDGFDAAFQNLLKVKSFKVNNQLQEQYNKIYNSWKNFLLKFMEQGK